MLVFLELNSLIPVFAVRTTILNLSLQPRILGLGVLGPGLRGNDTKGWHGTAFLGGRNGKERQKAHGNGTPRKARVALPIGGRRVPPASGRGPNLVSLLE